MTRLRLRGSGAPWLGRCREPWAARPLRAAKNCLTIRSSSEWNVTTASRPPAPAPARPHAAPGRVRRVRRSPRCAGPGRSASPGGCGCRARPAPRPPRSPRVAPWSRSARAAALVDRPRHRPRPALLAVMVDDVGEFGLVGLVDDVGRARPLGAHAHVEGAVVAEGEAALRRVELHRRDADIEHHAAYAPSPAWRRGCRGRRSGPAPGRAGPWPPPRGPDRPRWRADRGRWPGHAGPGRRRGGPACSPRAEGAVDDHPLARRVQGRDHLIEEHGDMGGTGRRGGGANRLGPHARRPGIDGPAGGEAGRRACTLISPWSGPRGGGSRDGSGDGGTGREHPRTDEPCGSAGNARRADSRR